MIAPGISNDRNGEGFVTRQDLWRVSWDASDRAYRCMQRARIAIAISVVDTIATIALAAYLFLA